MDIEAAYLKVITSPVAFKLGIAHQSVLNKRVRARDGDFPSNRTMRAILKDAGWKYVKAEQWKR